MTLISCWVAGVNFMGRPTHLKRMAREQELYDSVDLSLAREPKNKHDPNAIKVIWEYYSERTDESKYYHIGYIPKTIAAILAKDMDAGVTVDIHDSHIVNDYDYEVRGVDLTLRVDKKGLSVKPIKTDKEMVFHVDRPNIDALGECSVGDTVKLWVPKRIVSDDVYIYGAGPMGKIGFIPRWIAKDIAPYMKDKSKSYSARITALSDYECVVKILIE